MMIKKKHQKIGSRLAHLASIPIYQMLVAITIASSIFLLIDGNKINQHKRPIKKNRWIPGEGEQHLDRARLFHEFGMSHRVKGTHVRVGYVGEQANDEHYLPYSMMGYGDGSGGGGSLNEITCGQSIYENKNLPLPSTMSITVPSIDTKTRIANAKIAKDLEWPWQVYLTVRLDSNTTMVCGGTIISKWLIVTAGHCLLAMQHGSHYNLHKIEDITIMAGITVIGPAIATIFRKGTKFCHSDRYVQISAWPMYDYAVIKLDSPLEFSRYIQPICLPSVNNKGTPMDLSKTECFATGYATESKTKNNSINADEMIAHLYSLKKIQLYEYKCPKYFNHETTKCTASLETSSVVPGDSGGPMSCWNPDRSAWELHGILSSKAPTDSFEKPFWTAVTNVANVLSDLNDCVQLLEL